MATLEEITKGFPKKYVCVKNTVVDNGSEKLSQENIDELIRVMLKK